MAELKTLCTIAVREGSKGLPGKSLRPLNGKPLIVHTIEQALRVKLFCKVLISTDSSRIGEIAKSHGVDFFFMRPKELATDSAPKIPVIRHALIEAEKHYEQEFDAVVDLDITSPMRKDEDIVEAIRKFLKNDSSILFAVSQAKKNPYFNMVEVKSGSVKLVKELAVMPTCRQNAPTVYAIHASIYIWKRAALLSTSTLFTNKTDIFIVPEERSMDIDTEMDWRIVEQMMQSD
jgi:CMP-N-acetylneuraminic acid synthetase